jgi:ribosomal-protein-alanine N-acetyltransferase
MNSVAADSTKAGPILVREARPDDWEAISRIIAESPSAAKWAKEMVCNPGASEKWLVAEWISEVAAFVAVRATGHEAEILNFAVRPAARRKGIAKALLQKTLADLVGAKVHEVFLEVRESNIPAITFYSQAGFRPSGTRPGYYRNPNEAALCMNLKLTAQDQVPT